MAYHSLKLTRYGMRCLAASGHKWSLSFRGRATHASAVSLARTLGFTKCTIPPLACFWDQP